MTRRNEPGGPPAAAAPSGQPRVRRAVALPLHEGDVGGAAVSEALSRGGSTAAGAVVPQSAENVRPLVTAIPAAAVRAEAEVAARTFRPDDGRTATADTAAGGEAASGRSTSQSGRSGHWPLMAAAAVAGAVLVSVPLLSGGEKKTTGADALDPVAIAGAEHGAGNSTSAPVPDGSAGADVTFPAPTTPATTARAGAAAALPGGGRHGSATRTTTEHGDKAAEEAAGRGAGRSGPSSSPSAGSPHAEPHGSGSWPTQVHKTVNLLSAAARSAERAAQAKDPSSGGTAQHATTRTATTVTRETKPARQSRTATPTAATASHRAVTRTAQPQTSTGRQTRTSTATRTRTEARAQSQPQSRSQSHATTQRDWSTRVVNATYVLHSGESVASNRMRITMRTDGDLVISDEHGAVRWSSHTHGSGNYAVFQDDGNLAVYSSNHTSLWTSGTAGNAGAELVIQNDGNVVILSRSGTTVWAAGTAH